MMTGAVGEVIANSFRSCQARLIELGCLHRFASANG